MSVSVSTQKIIQKLSGTLKAKGKDDVVSGVSDGVRAPKITTRAGISGKGTN